MAKQKIHWFEWECPAYQGRDDSYTNAPGLITCKRCSKRLASRRTQRALDALPESECPYCHEKYTGTYGDHVLQKAERH